MLFLQSSVHGFISIAMGKEQGNKKCPSVYFLETNIFIGNIVVNWKLGDTDISYVSASRLFSELRGQFVLSFYTDLVDLYYNFLLHFILQPKRKAGMILFSLIKMLLVPKSVLVEESYLDVTDLSGVYPFCCWGSNKVSRQKFFTFVGNFEDT